MGHRRKSREYALQGLYMHEVSDTTPDEITSLNWVDRPVPDDIRDFAVTLIKGTVEHIEEIDELIQKHSKNWKIERLSIVDKSILRISIYALLHLDDIPAPVTINEGIELGKIYGGDGSGQFINGILDAIRKADLDAEDLDQANKE